jgi:type IV pilus assembly protein PilF
VVATSERHPCWGAIAGAVGLLLVAVACGGPSPHDVERSLREFELADQLRKEGSTAAAVEHLRKSIELDPGNGRAHALMGLMILLRGEYVAAVEHLREGERHLVDDESVGAPRALAEARNWLGIALMQAKKYDEAVEVLRKSAMDIGNTAPHTAWGNLGIALYESEEYVEALTALEQAVSIQPRFCLGYYNMGRVHVAQENLERAEEALTRAIEADEDCTERYQPAYRLRGEVRARLGRRHDAVDDLERCVEIAPDTSDADACRRLLGAE